MVPATEQHKGSDPRAFGGGQSLAAALGATDQCVRERSLRQPGRIRDHAPGRRLRRLRLHGRQNVASKAASSQSRDATCGQGKPTQPWPSANLPQCGGDRGAGVARGRRGTGLGSRLLSHYDAGVEAVRVTSSEGPFRLGDQRVAGRAWRHGRRCPSARASPASPQGDRRSPPPTLRVADQLDHLMAMAFGGDPTPPMRFSGFANTRNS